MKIIIFAGGTGTRMWPLSRRNSPKQFEKLKDNKSTLQLAVDRIEGFGLENIYISTNDEYVKLVQEQIKDLEAPHIFGEPAHRDLAAAVGLTLVRLKNKGIGGPVTIIWSDHFMDNPTKFREALKKGENLVLENPECFVFLGEEPRFANHNLGWIHLGKEIKSGLYEFSGFKYRPELPECERMFESGEWLWNPGYFIFDINFVLELYQKFMPEMFAELEAMAGNEGKIKSRYPLLEAISFDNAILEKLDSSRAVVLRVNLGWSDPGTLYALKEALSSSIDEHFIKGQVILHDSKDCFVYSEEDKLVAGVGLEGMIIVNTEDALLVCHKDDVPNIKELLKKISEAGRENYL